MAISREQFGNVGFAVLIQGDEEVYPGWQPQIRMVKRAIPGSNEIARYNMGAGPSTIALRLELDSHAAFMALQAKLKTLDTLVLRSRFTNSRGITEHDRGERWEMLPDTLLDLLSAPSYRIDGAVEVMATFERVFDPRTGRTAV